MVRIMTLMGQQVADASDSVLVIVDLQTNFLKVIPDAERVLERAAFLQKAAAALTVPVLVTAQYPERLGEIDPKFAHLSPISKRTFSCAGSAEFERGLGETERRQVVICGVESHICVLQTALDLSDRFNVMIVGDATSARTPAMHQSGLDRCRSASITIAHSESIVYEWLRTSDRPEFKTILDLVKSYPAL